MPNVYKSPAQVVPVADTLTTLYSVPSSTQTVVSNIHICNVGATSASVRVAVRPLGAQIANQHYVVYGLTITSYDTIELGHGITLGAGDIVSVQASSGSVSFNLYYAEVTAD